MDEFGNFVLILLLVFLAVYFFYWIVKIAVKHGIIEAKEYLANKASQNECENKNKE